MRSAVVDDVMVGEDEAVAVDDEAAARRRAGAVEIARVGGATSV